MIVAGFSLRNSPRAATAAEHVMLTLSSHDGMSAKRNDGMTV